MKKSMVLLIVLFFGINFVSAQTYSEVKNVNSEEIQKLQKKLEEIKDRRYYLEVTLPDRIKKGGILYKNPKTLQERYFAKEDSINLRAAQTKIEAAITLLENSSYGVEKTRTEKASPNNLPEEMSDRQYKRRSRTQAFTSLDLSHAVMNEKQELKGVLINNKIFVDEYAFFKFERTDIIETIDRPAIMVPPNTEKTIYLPMGIYKCTISYSNWRKYFSVPVDPRITVEAGRGNQTVHFWAMKERYDN